MVKGHSQGQIAHCGRSLTRIKDSWFLGQYPLTCLNKKESIWIELEHALTESWCQPTDWVQWNTIQFNENWKAVLFSQFVKCEMVMLNLWTFFFFWPPGLAWFPCSRDCGLKWLVICVPSPGHHTIYIGVHVPKSYRRRRRHKRKTGHREKKEKERISENYSDKSDVENADESSSSILKPLSEFPLGGWCLSLPPSRGLGKDTFEDLRANGCGCSDAGMLASKV